MSWLEQNNIYRYEEDSLSILYSPIARKYAVATPQQVDEFLSFANEHMSEGAASAASDSPYNIYLPLADYIPLDKQRKVKSPEDYSLLTVLPNNVCNFACTYCYSAAGRNGSQLSQENLKVAIDYFFDSKPQDYSRPLTISFMGGGEPMLSWNCVKFGVLYAREKSRQRGIRLNLRIITNGSVLEEETIPFILQNDVRLSISFEILPEIQNLQRKHYDLVRQHIDEFQKAGVDVQINSTITPANVCRIEEMVEILHQQFPGITNVMFEPVVSQSMFPTPADLRTFYDTYLHHIIRGLELADLYGISITSFAFLRTVFPLERACPGEFCITADGDITGCYCVAEKHDPLFSSTCYGTIVDGHIQFDLSRYKQLLADNVYAHPQCSDCKVKWNCGGGCFHQYKSYDEPYCEEVCRFTKLFVEQLVKYKVRRYLAKHGTPDKYPILFKEF